MAEKIEPGEWYLGPECKACKELFPVIHDPTKGKTKVGGPGRLQLRCPRCGHEAWYETREMLPMQAHQTH
jgi:hypothetical protein